MQQYLNILWIWFGLSKEEIKNIYYSKTKEILPGIHKWANQEKMMFLNGAYNYVIENFDDYINGVTTLRDDSALYFFNEWLIVYYVAKNYELALQKFNKSLEIDGDYTDSIRMKWMTLYKLGDPTESIGYLSDAIEKDKKNRLLYLELIEILENENRLDEAKKVKALLKENTPKARPNINDTCEISPYPNTYVKYSNTKKPWMEESKKEIIKEKFNYYKLGFWILVASLVIYYYLGDEIIQSYILPLVNQFF